MRVLLVNFDGMRSSCQDGNVVALATLFSRTLRDLLFDNEALLDLVTSAAKRAEEGGGALLPWARTHGWSQHKLMPTSARSAASQQYCFGHGPTH